jgi:hypothetical protein
MHRYCLTSRLTLSSRARRPQFDSFQIIFFEIYSVALSSCSATHGYCIECRPIMLPSVSTHGGMWPYSPINVRVLAQPSASGADIARWAGTCARSHSSRDVPRIGLMGFSGSRATSKNRDWKWITGCMVWGLTYSVLSLKPGSNQASRDQRRFHGGIKRVGLNRVAAVQFRLWGLYYAQDGRGRHLDRDRMPVRYGGERWR